MRDRLKVNNEEHCNDHCFYFLLTTLKFADFFGAQLPINFKRLTLGRTSKFIPPPWYKGDGGGGWMEPLPGVFDLLQ